MSRGKNQTAPTYRRHRRSGQAVVSFNGRDVYLGPHGSPESVEKYDQLVARWLAGGRQLKQDPVVGELILKYWQHCQQYHVKEGLPTREQQNVKIALRYLRESFVHTRIVDFGPLCLKAFRQSLIDKGHSRVYVNDTVGRIRRAFKWGTEEEIVPPEILHGLQAVSGLRRGRSAARETEPVKPVSDLYVEAIEPFVSRQVWAMICLQRLTGSRPGEIVIMRGCDIETDGTVWLYRPARHKGQHRGLDRVIALGPRSQNIIKEFLKPDTSAYLFNPASAEHERHAKAATHRRPNQRRNSRKTARVIQDCYTVDSYRRAITRGCDLAHPAPEGMEGEALKQWQKAHRWHPHQLRHGTATRIRKEFGIESAQVVLGHARCDITEVYARRNADLASRIALEVG